VVALDQASPEERRQLARQALVAQAVAAVGRDVDVEEPVVDAEGALRRRPERGRIIGGEDDDAVVVVAQAEFILGAQHARRLDPLDRLDRRA
jgi:hypothetical protein